MGYNRSYNSSRKTYSKSPIVKQSRVIRPWSEYQKDIFKDIANGTGNTQVDALAGTGKTSTIVEGFYHIPRGRHTLMCAFNKSIQSELESRSPDGVDVLTLHGLGYRAVRRAFPNIGQPDKYKLDGYIAADRGDDPDTFDVRLALSKAISLAKGYLAESPQEIDAIIDKHDIDTDGETRESFISSVIKIMNATKNDTNRLDFDDMVWFPHVHNLTLDKYDQVMIDEAQDLNLAQIDLALRSTTAQGRIISVGDRHQAIYGFRGADSDAIQNIVDRLGSKRLPLSVTYRCAKTIVDLAQMYVPELEAAPNAEEGLVMDLPIDRMEQLIRPGDFLLSRVNAPLLRWCLILLKNGIPANIQGRDVGKNLSNLIKKSKSKDVNSFLVWLDEYRELEISRLEKSKRDSTIIMDKVECLLTLCEGTNDLRQVLANIDRLFHDGDEKDRVILSSTHKAKGLERDRVFMLRNTYRPSKNQEERNLLYVAITRAKNELYLVA